MTKYLSDVNEHMAKTVVPFESMMEKINASYHVHHYAVVDDQQRLEGVFIFSYDPNYAIRYRVVINHLSARKLENIHDIIKLSVHTLLSRMDCDEVRVELHQPKGEANVDVSIKDAYKKNGFRWK
jgi:hypothetical protein